MTTSEKLSAAKLALKTKTAELDELMNQSDDHVPSDEEREQQKALTTEVKELTDRVETYEALEAVQARNARPIQKPVSEEKSFSRVSNPEEPKLEPGIAFARYVRCKLAEFKTGKPADQVAKLWFPSHPSIAAFCKAAVDPMSTADGVGVGGTALVYAQNLVSEFIDYLRPMTIVGQFGTGNIPSLRRVPFNIRVAGQTSGVTSQWVGQAKGKPVQKFNTAATTMTWAKIATITVLSDELARFSQPSADSLVRGELAAGIAERMDRDFVDPTVAAVAGVNPASVTNGIAALTPSGTDAAAVRADILQLLTPFITANIPPTSIVFIMPNTVALTISLMRTNLGNAEFPNITMRGGTLEGFPVIASQYCSTGSPISNLFIAAAASEIFLADDGQVTIDVSREASIEMSDDPENEAGTVVSMFQTNQLALRAERYINWALRRDAAVAYLDNVAYESGSPS